MLVGILAAEDTRRWDAGLAALLDSKAADIRRRAALAAGRIGAEEAVAPLTRLLSTEADEQVRAMVAFALGEIESPTASEALIEVSYTDSSAVVRARAVEALGKIAAALPPADKTTRPKISSAVLRTLDLVAMMHARPETPLSSSPAHAARELMLAALTAVLRARPANASAVIQKHINMMDVNLRATALNTLARLRVKDAAPITHSFLADADPIVRANAARVLGVAEDKTSVALLASRATEDADARVRVSSLRALAAIKDRSAAANLRSRLNAPPVAETDELIEVVTALGSLLAGTNEAATVEEIKALRSRVRSPASEIEIALARIAPAAYLRDAFVVGVTDAPANRSWQTAASIAEGLGAIAATTTKQMSDTKDVGNTALRADATARLRAMLSSRELSAKARPAVLRAFASFTPSELSTTLQAEMNNPDIFVRATAAELLAEVLAAKDVASATRDAATTTLIQALPTALRDDEPDAALAILTALASQPAAPATTAIESALASKDYLVRSRAATLLNTRNKSTQPNQSGANPYLTRVGAVASQFKTADYARALARRTKRVVATVATDKGVFTMELLPDAAPMTVDNFVMLAAKKFFDGVTFHRVVPNFVIQTGDPRGDGNGGPGYQIRCEINTVPYERGAIGMALSGKDTGGSQWFVTHSPQPHLDGGYTVFARVVEGMDVVDRIVRGDLIRKVRVAETPRPASRRSQAKQGTK